MNRTYNRMKCYYEFHNMFNRIKNSFKIVPNVKKISMIGLQNVLLRLQLRLINHSNKYFCTLYNPPSLQNSKYILSIQNNFSKFSAAIALEDQKNKTISLAFLNGFILLIYPNYSNKSGKQFHQVISACM